MWYGSKVRHYVSCYHPQRVINPHFRVLLAMPNYQERPDFYIEPENSIIAEVKAATIIVTAKFSARQTLRFPRLVKFRDSDKVG